MTRTARPLIDLPLIALLLVAAARAPTSPPAAGSTPAGGRPLAGAWAGNGFQLRTVPTGVVVQTGCLIGKIPHPVIPDKDGSFAATGYLNAPTTGFRLSDIAPRDRKASYTGKLSGDRLTLTVHVDGTPDTTYAMKRGARIRFPRCSAPRVGADEPPLG